MKFGRLLALALLLTGLASSPARAQQTLRLATAAPSKTIWQQQLDQFVADVAAETQGRLKIEVFYNSQLGSEQAVLPQVMRGRIDMAMTSVSALADQLPEAYLVSMLFYYDNVQQRSCILDKARNDYRSLLAPMGVRLLDWTETGTGQLSGTKPYVGPESVRGLRLGVSANPISNKYWESIGALPVMTPSTEAASNLATGLVDAYPTIPVFYLFGGISKVAPVLTKIDYVMAPATIIINEKTWEKLTKEDREGVERALARRPAAERSAAFYAFEAAILDMHRKAGGTVVIATDQQKASWRKNIDQYYDQVLKSVNPNGRDFFAKLEVARKACAK